MNLIRLAGRSENSHCEALSPTGTVAQGLTTKEPDDSMIEVAIAAVERVFDWRKYLSEEFGLTFESEAGEKAEPADQKGAGA